MIHFFIRAMNGGIQRRVVYVDPVRLVVAWLYDCVLGEGEGVRISLAPPLFPGEGERYIGRVRNRDPVVAVGFRGVSFCARDAQKEC
jgi:hypothetical protein